MVGLPDFSTGFSGNVHKGTFKGKLPSHGTVELILGMAIGVAEMILLITFEFDCANKSSGNALHAVRCRFPEVPKCNSVFHNSSFGELDDSA
jgi:hypothetical protein